MLFYNRLNNHISYRLIIFLSVISFQFEIGSAQTEDFQLWSGIRLDIKVTKSISAKIEEELRLMDNITQVDNYFTDAGISYNFRNNFTLGGYYRFIRKNEPGDIYSNIHRYYFDLEYDNRLGRWEFSLRTRYQSRYKNIKSSELGYKPENHSRNKIGLSYDIYRSPLKPELWCEVYYQLNNNRGNKIDKIRLAPELNYSINRSNRVKIYYMIEKECSVKNAATNYIVGIGYIYKI